MSKYLLENQTSERLIFRKLKESDFEEWLPFYHNPKSTQYWEGLPADPIEACIGRENHKMMLSHYTQTKNMLISYDKNKLGFF